MGVLMGMPYLTYQDENNKQKIFTVFIIHGPSNWLGEVAIVPVGGVIA
jgi:hypothetical protein